MTIAKEIVVTGIICITILEITALINGIDGAILSIVLGIIALAIGVAIPKEKIIRE